MYWSKTFIPTLRETPQEAESVSQKLLLRSGLIRMLMAGVYSYLPLGWRVLENITRIIREEMDNSGAAQVLLPALQPQELWQKSGRDKDMGEVMIRFTDRKGRKICLGPTHEEVITELVKSHISSYKQLPLLLYQIQTKFRDEIRPRFGLVRSCEFIMKDAYSFDQDQKGLDKNYNLMLEAYKRIFSRCGLDCLCVEADPGVMGGSVSHEFMVPAGFGEDVLMYCPGCNSAFPCDQKQTNKCAKCKGELKKTNTLEVGHIFKLGTKYSSVLNAEFLDAKGSKKPIIMGCYGIGVSRIISAAIEQNHDQNGIIWPPEVSPYQVLILPLDVTNSLIIKQAEESYGVLRRDGVSVLLDDRDERAGVKFKDADLSGITYQVIIGKDFLETGKLELKARRTGKKLIDKKENLLKHLSATKPGGFNSHL